MKQTIIIIMAAIWLFVGCSAPRYATTHTNDNRDSVRVEYRERIIHERDTVYLEIPAQTAEKTTQDSTSHLENEFAESNARINEDGSLYHDLKTKPQQKAVPTEKTIIERDSTIYENHSAAETEQVIKEVEVVKPLTWWQKTQIIGFWVVFVIVSIKNRKKLLALIKRLI